VNDNLDTDDCSTIQKSREAVEVENDESSFVNSQMFEEDNTNEFTSGIGRSVSRTSSISSHEKCKFVMPQITQFINKLNNAWNK